MRILIVFLAMIAGGILGSSRIFRYGPGGLVLGFCFGLLLAELVALRGRLKKLEKLVPQGTLEKTGDKSAEGAGVTPVTQEKAGRQAAGPIPGDEAANDMKSGAGRRPRPRLDRFLETLGKRGAGMLTSLAGFFTGGNLVLRVGIVLVLIGVSFLVKYAAHRDLLPLELRLAATALGGIVLLVLGWRLRDRSGGYGLVLQGGGIGILYLVIFGAGRLYHLLPMVLAFCLMIGLVVLSGLLAVLQDSRSIALFGTVGGFLAPVLMSTGAGNHVLLFSYFALLNCGVVGVAWFKAWRELNLAGFLFTFGIGAIWGSGGYRSEHFSSTEPFLLLFFVFYLTISVLFALRQPVKLRGFIDGPLVFGLPLVVSGLQYLLVKDFEFGMAFSAVGLGCFYLTAGMILWRRVSEPFRLLCETFLALGVVFASLVIPLGLDGRWSGAIWALEGAGMVWVGARQSRLLARHFGLLLQLGAGYIFLTSVLYPYGSRLFANQYYLGCFFLALSALGSGYVLDRYRDRLRFFEHFYALPLIALGLSWWFIGGIQEVDRHFRTADAGTGFLLYLSASSIIFGYATLRLGWGRLGLAQLLQLPGMIVVLAYELTGGLYSSQLLQGWGLAAWPLGFLVLYRALFSFAASWPRRTGGCYHAVSLWLLVFFLAHEAVWLVHQAELSGRAWSTSVWGIVPTAAIAILLRWSKTSRWPVGTDPDTYLGAGAGGLALAVIFWLCRSYTNSGDPRPLPYLPLVNPLEMTGLFIMSALLLRALGNRGRWNGWRASLVELCFPLVGVLFFAWLNAVVARCVHFYAGIPYYPSNIWGATVCQAAIAALWGIGALTTTVWATKNKSRTVWTVGALLLALTVVKLFLVDLSGSGTVARIVSFLVVGVLMLIIGYFSPIPPKAEEKKT
jgi:uncharacterized membrane protein